MSDDVLIDPTMSVNSVLERYPVTLPVLNTLGVDTCCGGSLSLAEAAAADGIDLRHLIDTLTDSIRVRHATA